MGEVAVYRILQGIQCSFSGNSLLICNLGKVITGFELSSQPLHLVLQHHVLPVQNFTLSSPPSYLQFVKPNSSSKFRILRINSRGGGGGCRKILDAANPATQKSKSWDFWILHLGLQIVQNFEGRVFGGDRGDRGAEGGGGCGSNGGSG